MSYERAALNCIDCYKTRKMNPSANITLNLLRNEAMKSLEDARNNTNYDNIMLSLRDCLGCDFSKPLIARKHFSQEELGKSLD